MNRNITRTLGYLVVAAVVLGSASNASAEFPLGQLLVSDISTIYLVNPTTGVSNRIATAVSGLGDVVFNPVTRTAFAVVGSDIVQIKATPGGYALSPFISGIQGLECLAVDSFGRVLFNKTDFVQHRIWRAELDGTATSLTDASFFVPRHMAFAKDYSKLYVFETPDNDVAVISFPSASISILASGLDFPPGGDSDAFGNVYVLESFTTAKISRITPGGVRSTYASQGWMNFVSRDDLEYDTQSDIIYATSTSGLYALLPNLTSQKLLQGSGFFGGLSLIRPGPGFISQQPQGVAVTHGSAAAFMVDLNGGAAATYQWRHDGTNILGATNPSLSIASVAPQDAGTYSVLVTTASGAELSTDAVLTLLQFSVSPVVTLSGPVGTQYQIEFADQLQPPNWQLLMTVTANANPMDVVDHTAANARQRFYRVRPLP